jgi:hypothetical protein
MLNINDVKAAYEHPTSSSTINHLLARHRGVN